MFICFRIVFFLRLTCVLQAGRRNRGLNREESTVILEDEQVAELKEAFELFDKDKAGVLKKDTLKNVLKQFGTQNNTKSHCLFIPCWFDCYLANNTQFYLLN